MGKKQQKQKKILLSVPVQQGCKELCVCRCPCGGYSIGYSGENCPYQEAAFQQGQAMAGAGYANECPLANNQTYIQSIDSCPYNSCPLNSNLNVISLNGQCY